MRRSTRGKANAEAIELTRRHCRHARIEIVGGNSPVGSMLGLPMGLLEVRCEHAPPPRVQGHQALELAIDFYEANCIGCPYRDGTRRAAQPGHRGRQASPPRRRRARRRRSRLRTIGPGVINSAASAAASFSAGEGHVVRDLAERPGPHRPCRPPHRVDPSPDEARAARQVIDAARGAPELFRPVLIDSLLELAADTADATAFEALWFLVRSGHCPPRRALEAALIVLKRYRSVDAGKLLALVEPDLRSEDMPDVLDQLIALASDEDSGPWHLPSAPDGLIAASLVDLPAVTERIIQRLNSDDDWTRECAADAARVLLALDATRVVALGQPLAASVRGADSGYDGYPHPTSSALRALAEAWRGEPELTRRIVEAEAAEASQEARDQLARVPWFLQRFREPWDASAAATAEAMSFIVRRAGGDWGEEAASHASDHLANLARDIPEAVAEHVDGMLGAILALCAPEPAVLPPAEQGEAAMVAALERESLRIRRNASRRHLAQAIGRCASANPEQVLTSVQALFSATTGDESQDRAVRTTMLDVLEEAVSPETLRDILPVTYTALLHRDQSVRSGGIDLWVACARVADALPAELSELAIPLLEDRYVIVHKRMLAQMRQLSFPAGPRAQAAADCPRH